MDWQDALDELMDHWKDYVRRVEVVLRSAPDQDE